ncbi:hypothetical protein EC9_49730 [Rosistilla ulvae]|uniref:Alpha/beta hydrolase family protein n=2 Tax=Rosistilla ulvae TaxID=1930277 RepID=A0A517M7J0_9BACT|nr:hypothetical protein EC9_49730 [Rosistilla ulvae]
MTTQYGLPFGLLLFLFQLAAPSSAQPAVTPQIGAPTVVASDDDASRSNNQSAKNESAADATLPAAPITTDPVPAPTMSAADEAGESLPNEPIPESVAADAVTKAAIEAELESTPLEEFDVRARDEVWTISSRHLGSRNAAIESLQFRRRIDGGRWVNESAANFLSPYAGPGKQQTCFLIHGNRTPEMKAIRRGLQTYDQTVLGSRPISTSIRFVIWMWPADQIKGQVRDVRVKAGRADLHAFYLARLITAVQTQEPVAVIGYSFGGRLAIGAMHLMGGGSLCGSRLPNTPVSSPRVNLGLVAPAIRNDCFITTRSQALCPVNRLFLLHNTRDQYLKLYRFLKLDDNTPALGYTGICGMNRSQISSDRIRQFDASQSVGSDHDYLEYLADKRIDALARQNLFSGVASNRTSQVSAPIQVQPMRGGSVRLSQ